MSARDRMRRLRERHRAGKRLLTVELDGIAVSETLVATGDLDPNRDDDPEAVRHGLQSLLARLFSRYA
jgi:hypothetical protein